MLHDRRRFLSLMGCFPLAAAGGLLRAGGPTPSERGRRFLASLLDPDLGLVPEFPGSKTYWLFHDNYLAAKVLERTDPPLARRIRTAIAGFGVTRSGKIELLFGEAGRPLPFRYHRLTEVKRVGEKVIKTEVAGDQVQPDWERYADLLFLAAIAEVKANRDKARERFDAGMKLWDGRGFADRASAKADKYATYKLALVLIAGERIEQRPDCWPELKKRLLAMQRADGGFITDYRADGRPVGQANVETTALAVLALDVVIK
jgi:hypothetical protein